MVPGPASIGIAKGVNETSERLNASSFSRFFIPLCSENLPVSNAKPDEVIINPPAIFSADKLIPKNIRIYFPIKNDKIRMIQTLSEVQKAIPARCDFECSFVNPTKMGTVPKGLITEKSAAKQMINNSIVFLPQRSPECTEKKQKCLYETIKKHSVFLLDLIRLA